MSQAFCPQRNRRKTFTVGSLPVNPAVTWALRHVKARLHKRVLSRQLDAILVARKLQLQNRMCKPGAILSAICRRDIAGVSNMFETCCDFSATKLHQVAATKIACVNGP